MNYQLSILNGERELHSTNDNVDVEIKLGNGDTYSATLFSLQNIESLMLEYKKSGECKNGLYLWAADMIIVKDFSENSIRLIIEDLIESGEMKLACRKIN